MTSSRFPSSTLHQRDPRSTLFDSYTGDRNRAPVAGVSQVRYNSYAGSSSSGSGVGAKGGRGDGGGGFRSATPNERGQYSDAVLSELENQNEQHLEGISAKVKMLKDITVSIGDEIRSSSSLADGINDSFDNTRVRLRGTIARMLRMAEKTGVGWRVWLGFFLAVWVVFAYVWLF